MKLSKAQIRAIEKAKMDIERARATDDYIEYASKEYRRDAEYIIAYIDSLEASGTKLTEKEWIKWIEKEATDYEDDISDEEMDFILERLRQDGYVS